MRQIIPGEYDIETGEFVDEIIDYPVHGVKFNYEQDTIDGTMIQTNDQELYISAQGIPKPQTAFKIIIEDKTFAILNVQAIEPYNVPVLYVLQIRS